MRKFILLIIFSWTINCLVSQKNTVHFTYSHRTYVHSFGLDYARDFKVKIGGYLTLGGYYQNYDETKVANWQYNGSIGYFNSSIGATYLIFDKNKHKIYSRLGVAFYNGPDFKEIARYNGTIIYADVSHNQLNINIETGVNYQYKRLSSLMMFDFARNRLRVGLGFTF